MGVHRREPQVLERQAADPLHRLVERHLAVSHRGQQLAEGFLVHR